MSNGLAEAIRRAESLMPGEAAPQGQIDARWQAIIAVGDFIESQPQEVLAFALRCANSDNEDLRAAIATCLIEHLLEQHFDLVFPEVERAVRSNPLIADAYLRCGWFGEADATSDSQRFENLRECCRRFAR